MWLILATLVIHLATGAHDETCHLAMGLDETDGQTPGQLTRREGLDEVDGEPPGKLAPIDEMTPEEMDEGGGIVEELDTVTTPESEWTAEELSTVTTPESGSADMASYPLVKSIAAGLLKRFRVPIRADVGEIFQNNVCICRKSSRTHECDEEMGARPHWLAAKDGPWNSSEVHEQYVCCQWKPWPDGVALLHEKTRFGKTKSYNLIKKGHRNKLNRMMYYPSFCFAGFDTPMDACPMNEEGTALVVRDHAATYEQLWNMKRTTLFESLVPKVRLWMREKIKWAKAHPKEAAWHVFKFAGKLAFAAVGVAVLAGSLTLCPECLAALVVGKLAFKAVELLVEQYNRRTVGKVGIQIIGVTGEATAVLVGFLVPGAEIVAEIAMGVKYSAKGASAAFNPLKQIVQKMTGYEGQNYWNALATLCETTTFLSEDTPLHFPSLLLPDAESKQVLFEIDRDRAGFVEKVRLRWKDQTDEEGAPLAKKMVKELEEQIADLQRPSSVGHPFRCDFVLSQVHESLDTIKKAVGANDGGESFESEIVKRDVPNGYFCQNFKVD